MQARISASVGRGGRNAPPDVAAVQHLLVQRGLRCGNPDSICGPRTIAAIVGFQRGFLQSPDGLIEVGGLTWRCLSGEAVIAPARNAVARPVSLAQRTVHLTLVPKPPRATINIGLVAVTNRQMLDLFGRPRASFSEDCQPVTDARLARNMTTAPIGRFTVTGLTPAVASLQRAFEDVRAALPDLHPFLGTAGMLCCRFQRGSTRAISNHSWGTAIDLKLHGVLDARGDDRVQLGLTLIAPILNRHGWYWGAAFSTEDAMHFEASQALVTAWQARLR